jgi:hypothetical protein
MRDTEHLSAPELLRLADWLAHPVSTADDAHAVGASDRTPAVLLQHVDKCNTCQTRLASLREQDAVVAATVRELDATAEPIGGAVSLDALTTRMMGRLRSDVAAETESARASSRAHATVSSLDVRRQRARSPVMRWAPSLGLLAASIATVVFLRAPDEPPAPSIGTGVTARDTSAVQSGSGADVTPTPALSTPPRAQAQTSGLAATGTAADSMVVADEELLTRGAEDPAAARLQRQMDALLATYFAALNTADTATVRQLHPTLSPDSLRSMVAQRTVFSHRLASVARVGDFDVSATVEVTSRSAALPAPQTTTHVYTIRRNPESPAGWLISGRR